MAGYEQRPVEAANKADREQRAAHDVAEMTAARSPHEAEMDKLSVEAPAGGYAKAGS